MNVLAACLLLALAVDVRSQLFDALETDLQDFQLKDSEAKAFIRKKRFLTTLHEECREGCYVEEIREVKGSGEPSHEYMRSWNCNYRTRCSGGYYCATTGTDYSKNTRLAQQCWRDAGWCTWSMWGGWGTCSTTCNPGTQGSARTRGCGCPSAVGGGKTTCSGATSDSRSQACSVARCSCGNPGTPANSVKSGTNYLYQDAVTYSCVTGYYVTAGSTSRTCDVNTFWTGTAPTCSRVPCPALTVPQNGTKNGSSYVYQDHVAFACDAGYERDAGDFNLQCQANRAWNGTQLTCKRITCGDPGTIAFSTRVAPGFRYLDTVTYTCVTGYEIKNGSASRQCQANRAWGGTVLFCGKVRCPDPGQVQNGTRTTSPSPSLFEYQDMVMYAPHTGYEHASGDLTRTCTATKAYNGTQPAFKRVTCPQPAYVSNSSRAGADFQYLGVSTYTCGLGYEVKNGTAVRTCQASRTWSGTIPFCGRKECFNMTNPAGAHVQSSWHGSKINTRNYRFFYLDSITWACNYGFARKAGDWVQSCLATGQWNGTQPRCEDIDECRSDPCYNGGLCLNLIGDFRCECLNGFSGKDCSVPPTISPDLMSQLQEAAGGATGGSVNIETNPFNLNSEFYMSAAGMLYAQATMIVSLTGVAIMKLLA